MTNKAERRKILPDRTEIDCPAMAEKTPNILLKKTGF
jgi:hypothetical protein